MDGSQTNGKYVTAIFGWSNAICCIGDGKAITAFVTIFSNSRSVKMFHAVSSARFVRPAGNAAQ